MGRDSDLSERIICDICDLGATLHSLNIDGMEYNIVDQTDDIFTIEIEERV